MNRFVKRAISLVLTLILIFSIANIAFAEQEKPVPLVYVNGEGAQLVVEEDGVKRSLFPFKLPADFVETTVKDNLGIFAKAFFTQKWDDFCDVIYDVVTDLYSEIRLDENGEPANGSRTDWQWRIHGLYGQKMTGNHASLKYNFYYDWRVDPYKTAETLHEYIEYVRQATGSDKVALSGRCLGACVIAAYMEKYDGEYVSDLILYASALNGATMLSKAFCGEIKLDADGIERYLYDMEITADEDIDTLLRAFVTTFNDTFGLDIACWAFNNVYEKIYMNIVPRLLIDTFATFPGYWSMVSDEDYQKAKDTVFHGADMEKYANFINIIDNYHYNVQYKAEENFNKYIENGIDVFNITKYGYQTIPATENGDILSDGICDVYSASMGATAMDVGKTFNKNYLKQAAANGTDSFISPDNQIDASTCFLPERTWFIKNIYHKDFPNVVDGLFNEIINNENFTVNSDENYPQYLVYNKTDAGETLLPMTDENKNTDDKYNVSFFKALGMLFKALFNVIKNSASK